MEDDINSFQIEEKLNFFLMEDDLEKKFNQKQLKVKIMVLAPFWVS